MKTIPLLLSIFLIYCINAFDLSAQSFNVLSSAEKKSGWELLFNGKSFDGWRKLAGGGWEIENGELVAIASNPHKQMDLLSDLEFSNFDFRFEFKNFEATNSGVKYMVTNTYGGHTSTYLGLEYQILDEEGYKYPERGYLRTSASLYDLIPAENKKINPITQWNTARIVVKNHEIEHWLNGVKVVSYDRSTQAFRSLILQSKYVNMGGFGMNKSGHILLQNEGSKVAFRNLKIKKL
jgi:hypothetical protein